MSIVRTFPDRFSAIGNGLHRPECVVATATGDAVASDWRGGISIVRADGGRVETRLARDPGFPVRPNGVSFTAAGSVLIAQLGECGGVWTLDADGTLSPRLTEIAGAPLPPTNFATEDERGRTWFSVSTRRNPRQLAWRPDVADGFIGCLAPDGARVAADGLHYANEVRLDPAGEFLYAVETFGRRVIRYRVAPDATLGPAQTIVQFGYGIFPDGCAFDVEGGLWVTSLVSNLVLRVDAGGRIETIVEERNEAFVDDVEAAFAAGTMSAGHLGRIPGTRLQHVTSLSFGGPDRQNVFLGSLHGECLYSFRSPVPGVPAPFSDSLP